MKNSIGTKVTFLTTLLLALFVLGTVHTVVFASEEVDEAIVGTPSISESKALSIAEKAYTGNGAFTDIELEMEKGVLVFAIEYTESDGNEVDVKINAKTGEVIVVESDEDEVEDDDMHDTEDDADEKVANMHTLINLLNQLIVLLKQQQVSK